METDHPQVHAALTAARVFRDETQTFANLSLYEQRLQRTLDKSLKQLQTLKAERRAQTQAALRQKEAEARAQAETLCNPHEMNEECEVAIEAPAAKEFVFSTPEINSETVRECDSSGVGPAQFVPPQSKNRAAFFPLAS
jgi:hypothetical protein